MSRICVISSDGAAYYAIVSRLRSAGLPFLSLLPSDNLGECVLVITTKKEAPSFACPTMALEDLDGNPDVARGQILAKLSDGGETLLVGIRPRLKDWSRRLPWRHQDWLRRPSIPNGRQRSGWPISFTRCRRSTR